ncbi:MAG: hypothetical protein GX581_09220 [Syntrophomonadaceae bacterium]|nr:hypothetical protein [Syntrophomonadaceae bacterium]
MLVFAFYALLKFSYVYMHRGFLDIDAIVPLLVYPLILWILLLLDEIYELPWKVLLYIPIAAFTVVAVYAVLQFFLGIENIMIPGLTYNWTEAQDPRSFLLKNNYYGQYTKIFSTYQNGNVFGVNLLLFFPLVFELLYDRSKLKGYLAMVVFITIALLTASRAVWVGVVFYIFLRFIIYKIGWKKVTAVFPLTYAASLLFVVDSLRYRANMFLGWGTIPRIINIPGGKSIYRRAGGDQEWSVQEWSVQEWQHEPQIENLSNRKESLLKLWEGTFGSLHWEAILFGAYGLLSRRRFAIPGEMLYPAIFAFLGLIGLILWFLPILFSLYNFIQRRSDKVMRGVLLGLMTYLLVAAAEGAYWLPPTAFNLWVIIGIGWLRLNHSGRPDPAAEN